MIKLNQQINSDNINSAFISKKATGTQIMLGGLNIQGSLIAKDLRINGELNTGSSPIVTTGTISAGTFSGSFSGNGANISSINASNISSGTLNISRMPSTVLRTDLAQTITTNKTFSSSAALYFAGGTTYYVDIYGSAKFNALEATGSVTIDGNDFLQFTSAGVAAPSSSSIGTKIKLYADGNYNLGVDNSTIWYDAHSYHKFYTNGGGTTKTERARIHTSGIDVYGSALISKDLEVQGEIKSAGANEFPDPLLVSAKTDEWILSSSVSGTISYDAVQAPTGTNANGSIKLTRIGTGNNPYTLSKTSFYVTPSEWITFSTYGFSTTTGNTVRLYIVWMDAEGNWVSNPSKDATMGTSWSRYSITAQAPANAVYCKVRFDNVGVDGAIMYFSAFQVERGRAVTTFKPFSGSKSTASLFSNGIKLSSGGEIHSAFNDDSIIKDHGNGSVTLSAAGTNLYLGYKNTTRVILSTPIYDSTNNTKIIDNNGALFYKGQDTDTRYVKSSGDTMTGNLTISKNTPGLTLYDSSSGGNTGIIAFGSSANQGVQMRYTANDGEIKDASGYAIIIEKTANNTQTYKASLEVEGNIYSDGSKVWTAATFNPDSKFNVSGGSITGDVTATKNLTVGGDLTINKTGYWSNIIFPAQTSDPGRISHYENNNQSVMYFSVSDDGGDTDYYSFGYKTPGSNYVESARIATNGNATFRATTVADLTSSGTATFNGRVDIPISGGERNALTLGDVTIGAQSPTGGQLVVTNLSELRFGSASNATWDYNKWGGIKHITESDTMVIGGPASSNFTSNGSTTTPRINLNFEGLSQASFDGQVVINPSVGKTIGGATMANGILLIGTTSNGVAIDDNEIYFAGGSEGIIGTIGSIPLKFRVGGGGVDKMVLTPSGNLGIGTTSPAQTLDVNGSIAVRNSIMGYSTGTGRLNIYSNTTSANSYGWIEMFGEDPSRQGELTIAGTYLSFRTGSGPTSAGSEAMSLKGSTLNVTGGVTTNTVRASADIESTGGFIKTAANKGVWFSSGATIAQNGTDGWIRFTSDIYANSREIRTDGKLSVGNGGSALSVTTGAFNWMGGTLYSDSSGKVSINNASTNEHPLTVLSNGSYQGINLQRSSNSYINGISFQNGANYTWHIARSGVGTSDLMFFSGDNASMSALTEKVIFYNGGGVWSSGNITTDNNIFARGGSGRNTEEAKVTLAIGDNDTGFNWISDGQFSLWTNNSERIRFTTTETIFYHQNVFNANSNFSVNTTAGRGYRFWNNDGYKIYMSSVNDSTWGGRMDTTSDYNMYFRMSGGTNRGFVFENGTGTNGAVAQIEGNGKIHAKGGYKTGNFEIQHNTTEDSLDFIYVG